MVASALIDSLFFVNNIEINKDNINHVKLNPKQNIMIIPIGFSM
jgi:hypothetical protein